MKLQLLCLAALISLIWGCSHFRNDGRGGAQEDQNVLTGGPVTGTRIKDLPAEVKQVLKQKAPLAEIADISTRLHDGRIVYRITFSEPAKNPAMYVAEDGTLVENMTN